MVYKDVPNIFLLNDATKELDSIVFHQSPLLYKLDIMQNGRFVVVYLYIEV